MKHYAIVAIVVISSCFYWKYPRGSLIHHEKPFAADNPDIFGQSDVYGLFQHDTNGQLLNSTRSNKAWSPLSVLWLRAEVALLGGNVFHLHVINILLHMATSCLVALALHNVTASGFLAAAAGSVLFAVHPINSEVAGLLSGRPQILGSIFSLFSFLLYKSRHDHIGLRRTAFLSVSFLCLALALLASGLATSLVFLFIVYDLLFHSRVLRDPKKSPPSVSLNFAAHVRPHVGAWLAAGCLVGAYWTCRVALSGEKVLEAHAEYVDNPLRFEARPTWWLTASFLHAFAFGKLLIPTNLACDYSFDSIPMVSSPWDTRNLGAVGLYLALAALFAQSLAPSPAVLRWLSGGVDRSSAPAVRKQKRPAGAPTISLPTKSSGGLQSSSSKQDLRHRGGQKQAEQAPANQQQPQDDSKPVVEDSATLESTMFRERTILALSWLVISYLPSSQLLYSTDRIFSETFLYFPCIGYAMLFSLLFECLFISLGWGKGVKPKVWFKLTKAQLVVCYLTLALLTSFSLRTLRRSGDWSDIDSFFSKSLTETPRNVRMWTLLGYEHLEANRLESALSSLQRAYGYSPTYSWTSFLLGKTYFKLHKHSKAEFFLGQAVELDPSKKENLQELGHLYAVTNRLEDSLFNYGRALLLDETDALTYNNMANVLYMLRRFEDSWANYEMAVKYRPDYLDAWKNYAITLYSGGEVVEAAEKMAKAASLAPEDETLRNYARSFREEADRKSQQQQQDEI